MHTVLKGITTSYSHKMMSSVYSLLPNSLLEFFFSVSGQCVFTDLKIQITLKSHSYLVVVNLKIVIIVTVQEIFSSYA